MYRRIGQLFIGLFLYGFAAALMVEARLGVDPWTVFAQGMSNVTGLSLGLLTILIGVAVMLLWIPLRQRPGVGTLLNMVLVGVALDIGLFMLDAPEALWQRIIFFVSGLLLLAIATGLYIGSNFGAGPRDGLMTGMNSRFKVPIWLARTTVEITVLLIGWALGGNLGIGTLVFALAIGPLCNITLPLLSVTRAPSVKRRDQSNV